MRMIAAATAASAVLVGAYLALGGASYAPAQPADPCTQREWRDPGGFQEVAEQIVLSALDSVACELDVSREAVVLALSSRESFERFAREQGVSDQELEELARSGLVRAIDEAEQADALNPTIADLLRGLARRIPITELLDLLDLLPGG
jgi:hypothetical protein